jgi:undecaprenyl diphosphate synthase
MGESAHSPRRSYHLAVIMDGNGRWAQARRLPRLAGHRAGTENLRRVLRACKDFGVKILTVYAFSTENWRRPAEEVSGLMTILDEYIVREMRALHEEGVQIRHLGRMDGVRPGLQEKIRQAIELTRNNTTLILNIAFNYGGRQEILDAVRAIVADGVAPGDVDEALFSRYLYTAASRSGPDHSDQRRGAHQQLPAVAGRLRRVVLNPCILARLRRE